EGRDAVDGHGGDQEQRERDHQHEGQGAVHLHSRSALATAARRRASSSSSERSRVKVPNSSRRSWSSSHQIRVTVYSSGRASDQETSTAASAFALGVRSIRHTGSSRKNSCSRRPWAAATLRSAGATSSKAWSICPSLSHEVPAIEPSLAWPEGTLRRVRI